ncbi:lipoyl(octanoyl) transferase LipB [Oerskovia sp. Sa1BUA8]|uniref:Octanoyltransferase n=1 Tax=Oerskovia douganii TaxID=2762210 RepID=A0A9D5U9H8_9CELL|nr:lipoyl(octanoyl) transferase LipB [Oerskovia douganii]MBE7701014.1 lipoyl(octanoyl) transferase LipB [Oerskovia douganii]
MHLRTEGPGLTDYQDAWDLQRHVHQEVVDDISPDTVILVEHPSVYTAGRRTNLADRPDDGTPVVDVDRGGKITWHGPGQLVAYPVVRLAEPVDVVAYVRALEAAVMDVCTALGLTTHRVEGRSGVWLAATAARRERKVCAIGVRVARGVTMHGLALNCCPDLGEFSRIVPCGIADADVTSLTLETGRQVTIAEATPLLVEALREHLVPLLAATAVVPPTQADTVRA